MAFLTFQTILIILFAYHLITQQQILKILEILPSYLFHTNSPPHNYGQKRPMKNLNTVFVQEMCELFGVWVQIQYWFEGKMENGFKVRALLSFSPKQLKETVEKARAKAGRMPHLVALQGLHGIADHNLALSLSPRKNRLSPGRLFRNARQISPAETYLPDKTNRLTTTNGSSSPPSERREERLTRPLTCARTDRSMSSAGRQGRGREIERTVSIVIGGKGSVETKEDLMGELTRVVLGQAPSDDLVMEWLEESSIHGEGENFVELDSLLLEDILKLDGEHHSEA